MTKAQLREKYLALRADFTLEEMDEESLRIANKVLELPIWDYNYYHLFLPIASKNEVNTEYLMNILAGKDKNILLPKSDFKSSTFKNILLTDNTILKVNKFGIPEPVEGIEVSEDKIDVVFIPLLAFDHDGNRIGYGKGFYDRFLRMCRKDVLKIGLSVFEAVEKIEEISDLDIPLDFCVTPQRIYDFSTPESFKQ